MAEVFGGGRHGSTNQNASILDLVTEGPIRGLKHGTNSGYLRRYTSYQLRLLILQQPEYRHLHRGA